MDQNNKVGAVTETQNNAGAVTETQTEEVVTIPKSQYLSELDRARTEAAKSREKAVQKKAELSLSELQREIEDLKHQNRMKDLTIETKNRLSEINALDMLPLFDYDFNDVNGRFEFAKKVKEMAKAEAEKMIKEKISTNSAPTNVKTSDKPVAFKWNMSVDEAKKLLEQKK
jgi:hypothetical protein